MLGQVLLVGDVLEALEALAGEAGGDAGELVQGSEVREAFAGQAEAGNVLGLVPVGRGRWLEALLREIGAAIEAYELFRVGFYVVQDLPEKLVGQFKNAHCVASKPCTGG